MSTATSNRVGRFIGRSLPRKEDDRLLRGAGTFVGDLAPAGLLHGAFYRSPYAHARLIRVDLDRVRAIPGVRLALSAADLADHVKYMSPFPFQSRDPFRAGNPTIKFHDRYGLAHEKVRFAGEPVAFVVADDRYIAEDAIELVDVEYEALEPVLDAEAALADGAPLLYEDWGDNVALTFHVSNGDVDQAFAGADVVVSERLYHHRFTGTPIEPRGLVASYDRAANVLTLWDLTQIPHVVSALLEDSFTKPPNLKVRVIAPDIGGGFGQKWGFYPEELVASLGSILLERPVKWIETRREHMVATNHAREQTHHVEMALKRDGTVLGVRDRVYANLGDAYPVGGFASIMTTVMYVPGAYRIQNYRAELFGVVTNKTPFGAHRGFGKSEAAYVIERMMDIAADRLGMSPEAIRFRNFIQPDEFPYICATGSRYDSGDYPAALKRALELADYDRLREIQRERRRAGRLFGIGMCLVIEPSSSTRMGSYNSGYFSTTIRMDPQGRVEVAHGGNDEGQGHATTISQLVAEELGIEIDQVHVVEGDTLATPYGTGSYSSRFSVVGTSSVTLASRQLADKIVRIAAHLLEAAPSDLELVDGLVRMKGDPARYLSLEQIARTAYHRIHDLPEGEEPGAPAHVPLPRPEHRLLDRRERPGRDVLGVSVRRPGRRGRDRRGHRRTRHRAVRQRPRLRQHAEPCHRPGSASRGTRPRDRRRTVRGAPLRRERPVAPAELQGLSRSDGHGDPRLHTRSHDLAVALHPRRLQGRGRNWHGRAPPGPRQCRRRRASPARHAASVAAAQPGHDLAGDPGCQRANTRRWEHHDSGRPGRDPVAVVAVLRQGARSPRSRTVRTSSERRHRYRRP